MSSQEIEKLLESPDAHASQEKALLLLDTRFHSVDELGDLDAVVENALAVCEDLRAQLAESQSTVEALISETRSSAASHLQSAREMSLLRHSLTDELSVLSREMVSSISDVQGKPTLLEDIETLHRGLKELESVQDYVRIIERALKLSETAIQTMHQAAVSASISRESVVGYKTLQDFVSKVTKACSQVEDSTGQQSLHLVNFLKQVEDKTWADMKAVLSSSLLAASEKLNWPMPVDYVAAPSDDRSQFEKAFHNLLKLQTLGEEIRTTKQDRSETDGLYPIQALVQPVSLRFKYHFEGSRQTNRIDKPEWFFTHILNVVHEHRNLMDSVIQNLLVTTEYRTFNAWREFTLLLMPLLGRKLRRLIPSLLSHPSLLAHTIYQSLIFDATLLEEGFAIEKTSASVGPHPGGKGSGNEDANKWDGISEVILGREEWFEAWMEGERKFADDQYHEIISSADAWLIADDEGVDVAPGDREMKSTHSARRIKALVGQVTDRYSPLPRFNQRTRFLLAVQLPLLEQYHARISSSLDAFETLSSALIRAVPGALSVGLGGSGPETGVKIDTRRLTNGVDGVQRLCKALVSTRFMEEAMSAWGEELFFLELWTEIDRRASLREKAQTHVSLPVPKGTPEDLPEGTIFEELVIQYRKLVKRAEDMIIQQVSSEIESGLRAHFASLLSPDSASRQPDAIAIPQTLLGPISLLSADLTLLRSTLPRTVFAVLYRRIASRLSEHIFQREILYRGHLSLSDAQGIAAECELWVETCHAALAGGASTLERKRIESPWLALLEAGRLVGLAGDRWAEVVDATFGMKSDEEWAETLLRVVGICELGREDVGQLLRVREDAGLALAQAIGARVQ